MDSYQLVVKLLFKLTSCTIQFKTFLMILPDCVFVFVLFVVVINMISKNIIKKTY